MLPMLVSDEEIEKTVSRSRERRSNRETIFPANMPAARVPRPIKGRDAAPEALSFNAQIEEEKASGLMPSNVIFCRIPDDKKAAISRLPYTSDSAAIPALSPR